jgi:catechol 2,3-dioxygenase-like lactoylglutathione lyase family enzyme
MAVRLDAEHESQFEVAQIAEAMAVKKKNPRPLEKAAITAFIATADAQRSKTFYRDILGLPLVNEDQFALVFDCRGVPLRIQKVDSLKPHPFTAFGWLVDDIRKTASTLSAQGVVFERYGFMEQDELGIWKAPSGAKVAWFLDPDGNLLSLTEHRRSSKRARKPTARRRPARR